jgi:hypothetical protein
MLGIRMRCCVVGTPHAIPARDSGCLRVLMTIQPTLSSCTTLAWCECLFKANSGVQTFLDTNAPYHSEHCVRRLVVVRRGLQEHSD